MKYKIMRNSRDLKNNQGFTLVELSIVLVIIGLLVGGVLQGRELIKAAERRSIITQMKEYDIALASFRLQYDAIPGDMKKEDAADYGFSNCGTYVGCGTLFMNGDGRVDSYNKSSNSGGFAKSIWGEIYYSFIHLEESEIMPDIASPTPGANIYSGCFQTACMTNDAGGFIFITDNSGRLFYYLGLKKSDTNAHGINGTHNDYVFTPQDAKFFDDKLDDGNPTSGGVQPYHIPTSGVEKDTRNSECLDSTGAKYNLSVEDKKCSLLIRSNTN